MNRLGELPSIENLQCFLAAVEHLHFRRAAKAVSLTPTAFGQRIRQIEEKLGSELFRRTTRSIELTRAGEALVPVAREAIQLARQCARVVHLQETPPAAFVVGTRFELGLSWLTPALLAARRERPQWRIELYYGSGPDIIEQLTAGRVDCIVTSAPVVASQWASEFLHPETYDFVGSPELLAAKPLQRPEDASDHVLVDIDHSLPLARYLVSAVPALSFVDVLTCGTGAAVQQFVLEGAGVGILPTYMAQSDLDAGRLIRLLPQVELLTDSFRLLYRKSHPLAAELQGFGEFLRLRPLT